MSPNPTAPPHPLPTASASAGGAIRRGRRGQRGTLLALVAAAAVVLAACSVPSNAPTAYDDAVRANFVTGCVGDIPETNNTTTTLAASDYCSCAYEVFVAQVPFNDDARPAFPNYPSDAPTFTTFNDDLAKSDDPSSVWDSLPQSVRDDIDRCPLPPGPVAPGGGTSSSTAPAESTTTTAAG